METPASSYYVNDLFVFEPTQKLFYAHEEFIYQFSHVSDKITLNVSENHLHILKKEDFIQENKEQQEHLHENPFQNQPLNEEISKIIAEEENKEENITPSAQNPEFQKHNFDLFLEVVNLEEYSYQLPLQEFIYLYISSLGDQSYKLAAYFYFRKKGFEIESGCIFSFDFLLYRKGGEGIGLLNKVERTHSEYAVFIFCEDLKQKVTFKDLHRKDRIAHNYNKVTFLVISLIL